MKRKILLFFVPLLLAFCFIGCDSKTQEENKIYEYHWTLEMLYDLEGNIIATNPEQPDLAAVQCDMTLEFNEDNSFLLSDHTNEQEWKGTYSLGELNKSSNSYVLKLLFENSESEFTGVYGIRTYETDNMPDVPSVMFQTESEFFSFLAHE